MKNLDKFFNKRDIPWVNLVWEKITKMGSCLTKLGGNLSGGGMS
jgi:hypothetical protein